MTKKRSLEDILREPHRSQEYVRTTVYLSKDILDAFKEKCGKTSVSRGLDLLLKYTIELDQKNAKVA